MGTLTRNRPVISGPTRLTGTDPVLIHKNFYPVEHTKLTIVNTSGSTVDFTVYIGGISSQNIVIPTQSLDAGQMISFSEEFNLGGNQGLYVEPGTTNVLNVMFYGKEVH